MDYHKLLNYCLKKNMIGSGADDLVRNCENHHVMTVSLCTVLCV